MTILFDGRFSVNGFIPYGTNYVDTMGLYANGVSLQTSGGGSPVTNSGIPGHIDLVTDPAGSGEIVMRSRVTGSDNLTNGSHRSELMLNTETLPYPIERWYSWSIYIPADRPVNTVTENIWQIHNYPDTSPNEVSVAIGPTMEMALYNDGLVHVNNTYDQNATTTGPVGSGSNTVRTLFKTTPDKGRWTDWVMHVVWSATLGSGSLQFFKNRRLIFSETNQINTYNDAVARGGKGVYAIMGSYYWAVLPGNPIQENITYYKGFRVGDSASSFAEVTGTAQLETVSAVKGSRI